MTACGRENIHTGSALRSNHRLYCTPFSLLCGPTPAPSNCLQYAEQMITLGACPPKMSVSLRPSTRDFQACFLWGRPFHLTDSETFSLLLFPFYNMCFLCHFGMSLCSMDWLWKKSLNVSFPANKSSSGLLDFHSFEDPQPEVMKKNKNNEVGNLQWIRKSYKILGIISHLEYLISLPDHIQKPHYTMQENN